MFFAKWLTRPIPSEPETTAWESSMLELPSPPPPTPRPRRVIPFRTRSFGVPQDPAAVINSRCRDNVACIPGEKRRHGREVPGG